MAEEKGGWGARWEHGRVWIGKDGAATFYIESRRGGPPFLRKTGVHSEREALVEWSRFCDDPTNYVPADERKVAAKGKPPLPLDDALITEYVEWLRDVQNCTSKWCNDKKNYLAFWLEGLAKRAKLDLRRLDKRTVLAVCPHGTKARPNRIAALKSLYRYLRDPEQRMAYKPAAETLTAAEDVMIDFSVPQRAPAQSMGKESKKKPVTKAQLATVLLALEGHQRDALMLLVGTGWRGEEIPRFAAEGEIEDADPVEKEQGICGTIGVFGRKRTQRRWKKVQIRDPRVIAAAKRLKEYGTFSLGRLDKAIRAAAKNAGIAAFGYGRIRHTVAGYAKSQGERVDIVAQAIGNSPEVAARNYQQLSPAPAIPTPLEMIDIS